MNIKLMHNLFHGEQCAAKHCTTIEVTTWCHAFPRAWTSSLIQPTAHENHESYIASAWSLTRFVIPCTSALDMPKSFTTRLTRWSTLLLKFPFEAEPLAASSVTCSFIQMARLNLSAAAGRFAGHFPIGGIAAAGFL